MFRILLAGALALALSACATAAPPLKAPTPDQVAAARLATESAYDASLVGLEQSVKAGSLTGQAAADARTSLLASYAVIVAGRASFTASGAVPSSPLLTAQAQVDADYTRLIVELPPS